MIGSFVVFALALAAFASCSEEVYRKSSEQGLDRVPLGEKRKYVIPAGQCNGVIDFMVCGFGGVPKRMSVSVTDTQAYPEIAFGGTFLPIIINRMPSKFGCYNEAIVELRVGCAPEDNPSITTTTLQPLPGVSTLPPMRSSLVGQKYLPPLKF